MTVPSASRLAIIVVNYASHELLNHNLVPLSRELPGAAVVVVDNFSGLEERAAMIGLGREQGWTVVTPDGNLGFGGGVNEGVREAIRLGSNAFLLLNPDARTSGADVLLLEDAVRAAPRSLFCPLILKPDGGVWFDGAVVDLERGETVSARRWGEREGRTMPWLTGACLMVGASLWEEIDGFDEQYFLYWEDVDLSARVLAAGGRVEVLRTATAIHDEGGTQRPAGEASPREKSALYYYYNIRNRQLFAALHLDARDQRAWRLSAVGAAYGVLLRGGRRQFLKPAPAVSAAIRGLWDGDLLLRRLRRSSASPPRE